MASSSTSTAANYPCPSDVNAADYITIKLTPKNYFLWRQQMHNFINNHDLLGFLSGAVKAPPQKVTVPDNTNPATGTKEVDNPDYKAWKKSDDLLRRWIQSTLNEEELVHVVRAKTAKEVWALLDRAFGNLMVKPSENEFDKPIEPSLEGIKNLSHYLPLHKAALAGDWESAKKFLDQDPDAIRAPITGFSETALVVAVRSTRRNILMEELVKKMTPEELALTDAYGGTALHIAALVGNMKAAKLLVDKNSELPNKWDTPRSLPIHRAALYGQRDMVLYLLTKTKPDVEPKPFEGEPGVRLLHHLIASGLFDIALFLLKRYPDLVSVEPSPLESMARMPSAFQSGTHLSILQRLIYYFVPIKLEEVENQLKADIENAAGKVVSGCQKVYGMFWKVIQIFEHYIKDVQDKKWKHRQALELVQHLCKEVVKLEYSKASTLLESPLRTAIRVGIHEIIEELVESFPSVVYLKTEKNQSMFHLAVVNRREKVFNLLYQFECKHIFLSSPDVVGNNGLHLAGCLEEPQKLNLRARAAGAALQVQRELQWFKEVEKFTLAQSKEQGNIESKTPALLFTEGHQDLVKDGEQWMKDTANSCTIVGALIATVVFAAAITVPGGNNSDGLPNFKDNKVFTIFGVSDALALFSSTSSVLMFLSILTSRYGEEDFLYALPKRLILGLVTLFLSIISMMVAFSATIYLVFQYKNTKTLSAVIASACVPVTLFAFLQFPLLLDMIKSTYRPRIFGKQSSRILF